MTLERTLIRRVVLLSAVALGTFAVIACSLPETNPAAAQTPSPALLIAIQGEGERALEIADPITMKVVGRVPLGGNPHVVAASDDGKLAFVSINNGGGRPGRSREEMDAPRPDYISVIDLVAQKEVRRVETGLGSFPHDIVYVGGKAYVTTEGYQSILRYDPVSDQIDWRMGVGQIHPHTLAISKDAKKIFTSNEFAGSVAAIMSLDPYVLEPSTADTKSPWKVTAIPVREVPEGIGLSPDEKEVWVASKSDGSVSIIDVATLKVSQIIDLGLESPTDLKFTPDGKRVLIVAHYSGEVSVLDVAARKEIKRIQVGKPDRDYKLVVEHGGERAFRNGIDMEPENGIQRFVIAPDGSHAYLTVSGSDRVAIIDLKMLEDTAVRLTPDPRAAIDCRAERCRVFCLAAI